MIEVRPQDLRSFGDDLWDYGYIAALCEASLAVDEEAKRLDKENNGQPSAGATVLRNIAEMLRRQASIKRRIKDGLPPL